MTRLFAFFILISFGCGNLNTKEQSHSKLTIYYNGIIYTCDSAFSIVEAFALEDSIIAGIGTKAELENRFKNANLIDLKGTTVYPGLMDAHCHFYALGKLESQVNLQNTNSWEEVIKEVEHYIAKHPNQKWITGRGWDQTKFEDKNMPNKARLDELFPEKAILLRRVDGHGAIANSEALQLANITVNTMVQGGEIGVSNGKLTGFLLDNAVDKVTQIIPEETRNEMVNYLLKAQELCVSAGLTAVTDAGLSPKVIQLIDSLYQTGDLFIRINAMISADAEGLAFAKWFKPKSTKLRVKSFKIYGDGALGSRGALLKNPYCDRTKHSGLLLTPIDTIKKFCDWAAANQFQICTHAIGDSANRLLLDIYGNYTQNKDLRWRIEHAQVVDPQDIYLFKKYSIIPSVQPTHATSDMRWAEERLCEDRMKGAYAYKDLLIQNGRIALGTDFPIEDYKPWKTFYAAVYRKDTNGQPKVGFQTDNALSMQQALMGMTAWAAYAQFNEQSLGSIQEGFKADFVIIDTDWFQVKDTEMLHWKPSAVYINGKKQLLTFTL